MAAVTVRALKAGEVYGHAQVTAELTDLNGTAVTGYADGVLVAPLTQPAGADGTLVLDLVPNADIAPANTYYTITIGGRSALIEVGSGGGQIEDLLVETGVPYDASALAVHVALVNPHQTKLSDLADVDMTGLADDDRPAWDAGEERWVPRPPSAVTTHASTHETGGDDPVDLSDQFTTPGQVVTAVAAEATARDAAIELHRADATNVHGIADTALLETTSGAQSKADAAKTGAESTAATALANHVAAADPHTGYQKESEKAQANGYASLDSGGLVPTAQLPALAITETYPVASQAAMLALTAQRGDVAIRSDVSKTFILSSDSPSTLADWKEVLTPADVVSSVNGRTGTVTGLAEQTDLASEIANRVADVDAEEAARIAADATKAPLASPVFTGHPTGVTESAGDNSTRLATTAYADAKVADAIADSVTGVAPSQNAVFDALALKAPLDLAPASVADTAWSGLKATMTAGEALSRGDVCYINSSSKLVKADADAAATTGSLFIALASISNNASGLFGVGPGFLRDDTAYNWTIGGTLYLSTTAGAITQTAPSGTADIVQVLGSAYSADVIFFQPAVVLVEVA